MTGLLSQTTGLQVAMRQLGQSLLEWRNDPDAAYVHAKEGLKLEADRRAHRHLVQALDADWPDIPVISEEDAEHSTQRPKRYWLIDPIDGTASWLNGFSGFVTHCALMEEATPVVGLVYAPALDHFYAAARAEGAFLNGTSMKRLLPSDRLVITDNTPEPHGTAAALMKPLQATGYHESGSLGLKGCLVADGTVDLCVKTVVVRDWDLAPVSALLNEVGGKLTNTDGSDFSFAGPWEKPSGFIAARDDKIVQRSVLALDHLEGNSA